MTLHALLPLASFADTQADCSEVGEARGMRIEANAKLSILQPEYIPHSILISF